MGLGTPRRSASGLARSSFETRCVSCAGAQHSAPPASSARGDAFRIQCGVCCRNSKSLCQPRRGRGRSREHQWGSPKRCSCERPPRRFLVNSDRLRPYRCGSPLYSADAEPDARPGDRRCRAGLPRPLPSKRPAVYNHSRRAKRRRRSSSAWAGVGTGHAPRTEEDGTRIRQVLRG